MGKAEKQRINRLAKARAKELEQLRGSTLYTLRRSIDNKTDVFDMNSDKEMTRLEKWSKGGNVFICSMGGAHTPVVNQPRLKLGNKKDPIDWADGDYLNRRNCG
jgi:hypothetical protein